MKKKLIDSLNIVFAKFLETYYSIFKKFRNPSTKILISGMPRGGTTWFGDLLLNIENSSLLWEPLRPFRFYEMGLNKFSDELGWFPYIPEDENWDEGHQFFKNLLNCEALNYKSILRHNSFKKTLFDDFMIIKCVTANQMLPWINKKFDIKTIYLLRHPCAVVSSMMRFDSFKNVHNQIHKYKEMKYSSLYYKYEDIIAKLESKEEKIAFIWCVQNIIPLESNKYKEKRLTIFYEDLILKPEEEITRIFTFIGKKTPTNIYDNFNTPSFTTVSGSEILKGGNQLSGWKKSLNEKQIDDIINVLKMFKIDLYNEDLTPNKNSIYYIDAKN
jgi:hypothetical protein